MKQERILKYIKYNPGLTATQLARLLYASKYNNYSAGSLITKMHKLQKKGLLQYSLSHGATKNVIAYRWFDIKVDVNAFKNACII